MENNTSKITIYWTRHAESCSNFDQRTIDDMPPPDYNTKNNIGYDVKENNHQIHENKKGFPTPTKIKATYLYHPNLSFIGMQHAILLGTNFYRNENIDVIFVSPTVRSIMTAILAFRSIPGKEIYVVPYITEKINPLGTSDTSLRAKVLGTLGFNDYQNTPVDSIKLKRIVAFIKDWLSNSWPKYFDDIEVINNLRKLDDILKKNQENIKNGSGELNNIIQQYRNIISDILNCKPSILMENNYVKIPNYNYDTKYQTCIDNIIPNLRKLSLLFKENNNIFGNNIDNDIISLSKFFLIFENDDNIKNYFKGPPVNFNILEHFESNPGSHLYATHNEDIKIYFDKFYTEIIEFAFKNGILSKQNNDIKICCISHGNNMRKYFSFKYPNYFKNEYLHHIFNTQVFEEMIVNYDYFNKSNLNSFNTEKYIPPKVRSQYKNFEILNMDICRTESVKGVINYPLWDIKNERSMIPGLAFSSPQKHTRDYATPDVKFALPTNYSEKKWYGAPIASEKDIKYYDDIYKQTILIGGDDTQIYKYKYIKYKTKFLKKKYSL